MTEADLQETMATLAETAVDWAREGFAIELDYSPDSLIDVEQILSQLHQQVRQARSWLGRLRHLEPTDQHLSTAGSMLGAYVGEVIRRQVGGTWIQHDELLGELALQLPGPNLIWPRIKVLKRLTAGAEDNVAHYAKMLIFDHSGKQDDETTEQQP